MEDSFGQAVDDDLNQLEAPISSRNHQKHNRLDSIDSHVPGVT